MGWIRFDQRMDETELLLVAGKCLFLCQHFEATCKDIVMWFSLTKALDEKRFSFLGDQHLDYVEKLNRLFLGQSVSQLSKEFGGDFSSSEIDELKAATASRNYVCHECLEPVVFAPTGQQYPHHWDLEILRAHVRTLAEGDYLVSRWSFEFHEQESGAFVDSRDYVDGLLQWVFNSL